MRKCFYAVQKSFSDFIFYFKVTEASHSMWEKEKKCWQNEGQMKHVSINVKCTALINRDIGRELEFINKTSVKNMAASDLEQNI